MISSANNSGIRFGRGDLHILTGSSKTPSATKRLRSLVTSDAFSPASGIVKQSYQSRRCKSWNRIPDFASPERNASHLNALRASEELVRSLETCRSVHDTIQLLSPAVLESQTKKQARYIVGIAGPPGGGKSTIAAMLCEEVNRLAISSGATSPPSVLVPMDGFHLYRWQLDRMDDPEEAHARRGAHWTFDAEAFVRCLESLRDGGAVSAPSFDHGVGDPVASDIDIRPHHTVVVVEGNYLLLDIEPWRKVSGILDEVWYVDTPVDVAMERIFERQTGNGLAPETSRWRIANNDRPNAELVLTTRTRADLVLPSLPLRG